MFFLPFQFIILLEQFETKIYNLKQWLKRHENDLLFRKVMETVRLFNFLAVYLARYLVL